MFFWKKTRIMPIVLTIVFLSGNAHPILSSSSGDLLTTSSYENFFIDQFDEDQAYEIVKILSNATFEGRLTATRGQHLAAKYIAARFAEIGLLPAGDLDGDNGKERSYFQNFILSPQQGRNWTYGPTENVLGWLPGINDEMMIISAHYDHLGNWVDEEPPFGREEKGLYPGADDNASGVAVLLELAKLFEEYTALYGPPNRSILFACWSGEEEGLHGSTYYYRNPTLVSVEEMVLNINLDMIGGSRTENFGFEIEGGTDFPELYEKFEMASAISGIPVHNTSLGKRSDHYAAYMIGIPAVLIFWDTMTEIRRSHPYYHTPRDTPDMTDPANLKDAGVLTGLVLQSYCFVDLADTTPPVILKVVYFSLDVGQITFVSRVVDNMVVEAVTFHYSRDGGKSWSNKPMITASAEYMASIEAPQEGVWILFYVSATDTSNNTGSIASSEILVDTTPPSILNVQSIPTHPTEKDGIVVRAQVEDNLVITSVILQYSTDGGDTWKSVPMQLTEDLYIAKIGPFPSKTNITYYVIATDIGGNSVGKDDRELYQFLIRESPVIEFGGFIMSVALIFSLLVILVKKKSKNPKNHDF